MGLFFPPRRFFGVPCDPSIAPATRATALYPPDFAQAAVESRMEGTAEGWGERPMAPLCGRPMAQCRVHCADALEFVTSVGHSADYLHGFDAILLDVYTSGQLPPSLLQPAFFSGLQVWTGGIV